MIDRQFPSPPACDDLSMTELRAVVFDAVDTLMTPNPPAGEAYWMIGRRHGSNRSCSEVKRRFHSAFHETPRSITDDPYKTSEAIERDFWRSVVATVFDDLTDGSLDACFRELFEHFADPKSWRVYPDVPATLEELRSQGLTIAVASNFDARLHAVFRELPALAAIDRRFVSSEIGWRKPDRRFFAAVCESLGCEPEQVLYVGDEPLLDVAAAKSARLSAILLQREGPARPDAVTSLRELLSRCGPLPTVSGDGA